MPEPTIQEQIAELEATITQQVAEMMALEAEVDELKRELDAFEREYDTIVKPVSDRVEAVKAAIRDLEDLQRQKRAGRRARVESLWKENPWAGPSPAERAAAAAEQARQASDPYQQSVSKPEASKRLKKLYRKLARRYHPDFAEDDDDRAQRNRVMAMINDAYRDQDLDTLLALDESPEAVAQSSAQVEIPLAVVTLRRLQEESLGLMRRINDLQAVKNDLYHNGLLDLKIQVSIARSQGEDLLKDIAQGLEDDYWTYIRQLDELRASVAED